MSASSQVARICYIPLNDGPLAIVLKDLFHLSRPEYELLLYCAHNYTEKFSISTTHVCVEQRPYLYTLESKGVIESEDGKWQLAEWGKYVLQMVPVALTIPAVRGSGGAVLPFRPRSANSA